MVAIVEFAGFVGFEGAELDGIVFVGTSVGGKALAPGGLGDFTVFDGVELFNFVFSVGLTVFVSSGFTTSSGPFAPDDFTLVPEPLAPDDFTLVLKSFAPGNFVILTVSLPSPSSSLLALPAVDEVGLAEDFLPPGLSRSTPTFPFDKRNQRAKLKIKSEHILTRAISFRFLFLGVGVRVVVGEVPILDVLNRVQCARVPLSSKETMLT